VLPKDTLSSPSGGYIPSEGMCPLASPSTEIPRRAAYEFLSSASKGKHRLARCRPLPPPPPLRLPPQNHLACLDHLARPRVHGHPRARAITYTRARDPSSLHRSLCTCRGQSRAVSRFMVSGLKNISYPFSSGGRKRATLVRRPGET